MLPLVHVSSPAWLHVGYCLAYVSPFYWFLCQLVCLVTYFKSHTNKPNNYVLKTNPTTCWAHVKAQFLTQKKKRTQSKSTCCLI